MTLFNISWRWLKWNDFNEMWYCGVCGTWDQVKLNISSPDRQHHIWHMRFIKPAWTCDNAIWNPGRKYAGDLAGKKSAQLFSIKMWVSARRKDGGGLVMIITMKSFLGWWWWSPWRVLYPILILFPILVDDEHRHEECCVLWRGASQGSLPVDKIGIHHCFRHTDHHFKKNRQRNHYSHLLPTSVGSLMWMFTLVPTHKEMKHLPTLY